MIPTAPSGGEKQDLAEAHVGIASVTSALGRSGEAVASARKAVQLFPENGSYLLNLGWYTYEAGEYSESIDASRRAIQVTPKEPLARFNLGLASLASGDHKGRSTNTSPALSLDRSKRQPIRVVGSTVEE